MRTGTFLCWLFGHKFIGEKVKILPLTNNMIGISYLTETSIHSINFCVRCGIKRQGINDQTQ